LRLAGQDTTSSPPWSTQRNYLLFRFPSTLRKYIRNHSIEPPSAESGTREELRRFRAPRVTSHWLLLGYWDLLPFHFPELEYSMQDCSRTRTSCRDRGPYHDGSRPEVLLWEVPPVLYWRRLTRQERVVDTLVAVTTCSADRLPESALVVEEETAGSRLEKRPPHWAQPIVPRGTP
jgi:hypothetical protein